jgi:hypothetical protein
MFKNACKLPTDILTYCIRMRNLVEGELGLMEAGVSMRSVVEVMVSDGDIKCRQRQRTEVNFVQIVSKVCIF